MAATRRELLRLTAAGAGAAWLGCKGGAAPAVERDRRVEPSAPPAPGAPLDDAVLDELLAELHAREPESVLGLSTHAPMVMEALCALGRADHARSWLARYDGPVRALPVPRHPIDPARWRDALGPTRGAATWEAELHRYGDWRQLLERELAAEAWPAVLDR